MCTHGRYIFNRYSRKLVFVRCGKCDACKQENAFRRANRIRNNVQLGTVPLFVTLTYTNDYVPYILRSDLLDCKDGFDVNIYRNASVRWVYDPHSQRLSLKKSYGITPLDSVFVDTEYRCSHSIRSLSSLNGLSSEHIGVCFYPDIQDFFKRLRQFLIRHYNYEKSFSYFSASEYGGCSFRPHFHALIFCPSDSVETFRSAICQAWPYADRRRTAKFIEIARDAANYVSSYVSCSSDLQPLLQNSEFKQKHSQSKGFGVVLDCFSLPQILQKIDSGDLVYHRKTRFDGETSVSSMPIPLYVLYRYFPNLKGFSWLSPCQLRAILLDPSKLGDVLSDFSFKAKYERLVYDLEYDTFSNHYTCKPLLRLSHIVSITRQNKLNNPCYSFTPKETYSMYVRLENCYQRFHSETGLSRYDYAFYYERVFTVYHSMLLRLSHDDKLFSDYSDFYINGNDVFNRPDLAPTLSNLNDIQIDPNKLSDVVNKTANLNRAYSRMNKQHKVTNHILSKIGYDV